MNKPDKAVNENTGEVLEPIPEGFEQFDNDLDEFPNQDWDVNPSVVGEFVKTKTAKGTREDPDETTRYIIVKNPRVTMKVWEQAHLSDFFDTLEKGMQVFIQHTGMKPLKKGKKMRLFNVYSRTEA